MPVNPLFAPLVRPLGPITSAVNGLANSLFRPPQTTISTLRDDDWPAPLQPVTPMGPPSAEPLGWQVNWGQNLIYTQRQDALYSAMQLRQLSRYVIARICIDNNKDILSKMPWKVQLRAKPGETHKQRAIRAQNDPNIKKLSRFFERPSWDKSWSEFIRPVIDDMLTLDAPSIFIGRERKTNNISELRFIEGSSITVLVDEHGWTPKPPSPAYQQTWQGYPRIDLTAEQLVYRPRNIVPGNTISSFLYGLSPCETVAKDIEIGIARLQFILDFYCYSDDTEVMTRRGWLKFVDCKQEDEFATRQIGTGIFEWQKATEFFRKHYEGPLYHFTGKSIDLFVTPNHRMLVNGLSKKLQKGRKLRRGEQVISAEELAAGHSKAIFIPSSSVWYGQEIGNITFTGVSRTNKPKSVEMTGDQYCAFMGMYLAEGYVNRGVGFNISQPRDTRGSFKLFGDLLKDIFGNFFFDEKGGHFEVGRKVMCSFLTQFGHSYEKFIPENIKNATSKQLRIFWKYYNAGDGTGLKFTEDGLAIKIKGQSEQCLTVSRRLADDLTEIIQKIGMAASVYTIPPKEGLVIARKGEKAKPSSCREAYMITARYITTSRIRKASKVDYCGPVCCVVVPNKFLYVRRNGKACWSGNTKGTVPGAILFAPLGTPPDKIKEAQQFLDSDLAGNLARRRQLQVLQGFQTDGKTEQLHFPKEPTLADVFDDYHIRKICFAFGTSPTRLQRMMNRSCYSEDTETLTDRGWLTYDKVLDGDLVAQFNPDKNRIEFVLPSALHVYPYSGDMIQFKSRSLDILVTPEHNMWTRRYNGNEGVIYKKKTNRKSSKRTWGLADWSYKKVKAGMIDKSSYFVASASYQGEERSEFTIPGFRATKSKLSTKEISEIKTNKNAQSSLAIKYKVSQGTIAAALEKEIVAGEILPSDPITLPMDDWLELLGYLLSEGRISHEDTCYEVEISQSEKSPFTERIDSCLKRLSPSLNFVRKFREYDKMSYWVVNSKQLHSYLKNNTGGYHFEKKIPREFLEVSARQLRILFDAMMAGDGSWDEGSKGGRTRFLDMRASTHGGYYTTSYKLANDFQELATKLNFYTSINSQYDGNPKHDRGYEISLCLRKEHFVDPKQNISKTNYEGFVYCFEVPSGIFVTRRNGKVAFQGNSSQQMQEAAEEEGTLPWLSWLKGTVDYILQVLMKFEEYEFAFDPFIETDVKKLAEADEIDIKMGLYTRNEKREARGDDPRQEKAADELTVVTSTGVIPLDMMDEMAQAEIKSKTKPSGGGFGGKAEKTNGLAKLVRGCEKHKNSYPRIQCVDCVSHEFDVNAQRRQELELPSL